MVTFKAMIATYCIYTTSSMRIIRCSDLHFPTVMLHQHQQVFEAAERAKAAYLRSPLGQLSQLSSSISTRINKVCVLIVIST